MTDYFFLVLFVHCSQGPLHYLNDDHIAIVFLLKKAWFRVWNATQQLFTRSRKAFSMRAVYDLE